MYVHTRERDSRPGFDGVKIKLLLLLLLHWARRLLIREMETARTVNLGLSRELRFISIPAILYPGYVCHHRWLVTVVGKFTLFLLGVL